MVDSWRARIAAQPELARLFFGPDGRPDEQYKAAIKRRFVHWVLDTCNRPRDPAWLDYQEEIGLRHTPAKKTRIDGANTPLVVPLRYLIAFVPVVSAIGPFLSRAGEPAVEVEKMRPPGARPCLSRSHCGADPTSGKIFGEAFAKPRLSRDAATYS